MRVHDVLIQRKTQILEAASLPGERAPAGADRGRPHLRRLVASIGDWMQRQDRRSEEELRSASRAHAEELCRRDLPLAELLRDHRSLRRAVTGAVLRELWTALPSTTEDDAALDELLRLDLALYDAAAEGVRRHVELRMRTLATVQERLRLALESASIGTWDLDVASGVFALDERCRKIFGLPREAASTYDAFLKQLHPEDRERVDAAARAALKGSGAYRAEYRIVGGAEGTVRWVKAAGSAIFGDDGRAVRFIGTAVDVTEEKRSEETRERYLGILGHDLREPLASISMTVQQLVRSGQLPGTVERTLARIGRASDRMSRMTHDLVDLARGRLGGLVVAPVDADLSAICSAVVEELQAAHPDRALQLQIGASIPCRCDRDRIAQAITNLVANALAYGADPVVVATRDEGDQIGVDVQNAGVLPEEERAALFEPFRRGQKGRAAGQGLGLGLYIVAQIAKAHGGSASCRADRARTVFSVRWPRDPRSPA